MLNNYLHTLGESPPWVECPDQTISQGYQSTLKTPEPVPVEGGGVWWEEVITDAVLN